MAKLENWTLCTYKGRDNKENQYLIGIVYGHPKADEFRKDLTDGHEIITSNIVSFDMDNRKAITQSGTVYELGNKRNETI